jgi:hypothetical protein
MIEAWVSAQMPTEQEPDQFKLSEPDDNSKTAIPAAPEVDRGLRELAEFRKDQRPYSLADTAERRSFLGWSSSSGPAGWLRVQWRRGIGLVLKLLRVVDEWAYLISVPFIILMVFGIVVGTRGFVHVGAVAIVLGNYGRFWTDLLAVFVRPFKEGPLHGLAFLFPPYGIYHLITRWAQFKPTFRRMMTSCIPIVLVVLAYSFIPFVNPDVERIQGIPEKLESGERKLLEEIREFPEEVENNLRSFEKSGRPSPGPRP